ncbi:MAG: PIN domain-containing protein [Pseudonocardiaceae bacterium]
MIACDTSVLVAGFARWHAEHALAAAALHRVDALVDHVAVETFSVLMRLPPPRRVAPQLVTEFLEHHFPAPIKRLPSPGSSRVLDVARLAGVVGGAVYDLMVGLAAADAGATLLSLDRRAVPTYEAAGTGHELLGS